jgi:hypothetical protein
MLELRKKKYLDEKNILFIIYREQVHQFFHRIEQVDNMAVCFSKHEHFQSIQSLKKQKK